MIVVIEVKKVLVGVWKRKWGIEVLILLKEFEIGIGGFLSWDMFNVIVEVLVVK